MTEKKPIAERHSEALLRIAELEEHDLFQHKEMAKYLEERDRECARAEALEAALNEGQPCSICNHIERADAFEQSVGRVVSFADDVIAGRGHIMSHEQRVLAGSFKAIAQMDTPESKTCECAAEERQVDERKWKGTIDPAFTGGPCEQCGSTHGYNTLCPTGVVQEDIAESQFPRVGEAWPDHKEKP